MQNGLNTYIIRWETGGLFVQGIKPKEDTHPAITNDKTNIQPVIS